MTQRGRFDFGHIIPAGDFPLGSELDLAQKVTFRSFIDAEKNLSAHSHLRVNFHAAVLKGETPELPRFFRTIQLQRSTADFSKFHIQRKLPLIDEILQSFLRTCRSDILIYSNIDIGIQPEFYLKVSQFLERGADALAIYRRTHFLPLNEIENNPDFYRRKGRKHIGADCFVFRRSLLEGLSLGDFCLGVPHLGALMISILSTRAKKFQMLTDERLTFHINDSRNWKNPQTQDYYAHNLEQGIYSLLNLHAVEGRLSKEGLRSLQFFRGTLKKMRGRKAKTVQSRPMRVLIGSFPRSGNTWMRFLIAHLIVKKRLSSLDQLHFLIPDAHNARQRDPVPADDHGRIFIKSHRPTFNRFDRVIYLIRDPRDVMISYHRYLKDRGIYSGSLEAFLRSRHATGFSGQSWEEHVRKAAAFKAKAPDRILFVRYEDLLRSPTAVMTKVARFLGLAVSRKDFREAVRNSSFQNLRMMRGRFQSLSGHKFFREGRSGQWKELPPKERTLLERRFHRSFCRDFFA